ncbi:MAG: DUF4258 domain-containing protein [Oligoflexia bacterium]|nr:DUF4258 domain-containing protein [Oligoflexia bacterium]
MKQRGVTYPEIEFVLFNGFHNKKKDKFNQEYQCWDYAIEGKTVDGKKIRIIVTIISPNVLVVTIIDLNRKD